MKEEVPPTSYVVVMVALIVTMDFLVIRTRVWPRLAANVGTVLALGAFYFRFFKRL